MVTAGSSSGRKPYRVSRELMSKFVQETFGAADPHFAPRDLNALAKSLGAADVLYLPSCRPRIYTMDSPRSRGPSRFLPT